VGNHTFPRGYFTKSVKQTRFSRQLPRCYQRRELKDRGADRHDRQATARRDCPISPCCWWLRPAATRRRFHQGGRRECAKARPAAFDKRPNSPKPRRSRKPPDHDARSPSVRNPPDLTSEAVCRSRMSRIVSKALVSPSRISTGTLMKKRLRCGGPQPQQHGDIGQSRAAVAVGRGDRRLCLQFSAVGSIGEAVERTGLLYRLLK